MAAVEDSAEDPGAAAPEAEDSGPGPARISGGRGSMGPALADVWAACSE